jgi:tetratricopeptide (TPR) repeat protein
MQHQHHRHQVFRRGVLRYARVALLTVAVWWTPARFAHASSVDFLIESGLRLERTGELDQAVARFSEALVLDASQESTYLHLARVRERLHQTREALQVYDVLLARKPESQGGHLGRARLNLAIGETVAGEAELCDLLAQPASTRVAAETLSASLGSHGSRPAQLALWRRVRQLALRAGDASLERDSAIFVNALVVLVDPADPAAAPAGPAPPFRRGVARTVARR